jgi:hypothetical protein
MSAILNDLFTHQISEEAFAVDPYSEQLAEAVDSLSSIQPNVVLESQQWSKLAAIQTGATIYTPEAWAVETETGNPCDLGGAWVVYYWDRHANQWDLAWVATWPESEDS